MPSGSMEHIEYDDNIKELARRLFAATISWKLRVTLQHAYKDWANRQDTDIGPYWIELAKQVAREEFH